MAYPDDLKLRSSMTLFKKAEELSDIVFENIFNKVLERYYRGEEDNKTLIILEKQKYKKDKENTYSNKDNNSTREEKEVKEKIINDEDNEDKKEDNKINNNLDFITNDINNEYNKNKIQHLDSIEILSKESVEKSEEKENRMKKRKMMKIIIYMK